MQGFRNSRDFLGWLNECVVVRMEDDEPHFLQRPDVERRHGGGQRVLPLEKPKRLVWGAEVDQVVEGPCGNHVGYHDGDLRRFPMGEAMRLADEPEDAPARSWLHEVLGQDRMADVRKIVVFPTCCGYYSDDYKRLIRELFPQIEWSFVDVRDLYENGFSHPDWIAKAFVDAAVLRIE